MTEYDRLDTWPLVGVLWSIIEYDRPPHIEYCHFWNTKPVHGRYSITVGILYYDEKKGEASVRAPHTVK